MSNIYEVVSTLSGGSRLIHAFIKQTVLYVFKRKVTLKEIKLLIMFQPGLFEVVHQFTVAGVCYLLVLRPMT